MTALVTFLVWTAPAAQAQFPDREMLNTLRERLLTPSDAYPKAADIPSVVLRIDDRRMTIEAEVHAAIRTAVPLPGNLPAWTPSAVFVDGKPEVSLRRDKDYLWIVVPEGVHKIRVEGVLSGADEWQWTFALKPRQVTIEAPEWTVSGVRSDGVPEQQIFFVRKDKSTAGEASYERQEFQTVAAVERNLQLGLVWQVQTTVTRLSPDGRAIAIRVPLLAGEKVLSANAVVRDGLVEVRLGANDGEFSWESELPVTSKIELKTKAGDPWVERWHVLVSPVWNLAISGLAPTFEPVTSQLVPVWQPWPGESTELTVSRPEAIAGATVTVDSAKHDITLGKRQRVSQLNLSVRSSLGEDFLVDLPAAADISSLSVQGKTIPVRKDGTKLIIPLQPGEQSISVGWKASSTLGFFSAAEEIKLPVASANIETTIHVPSDRWILWTHGPLRGPAVRFWSILVCALIAAWVLGRLDNSPLRSVEWMLLAIGLTQVPLPAALGVIGWLFFLVWRGRASFLRLPAWGFNALQLFLIVLTAGALAVFVAVVAAGLLGNPEMFILGNGFSPHPSPLVPGALRGRLAHPWLRLGLHLVVSLPHAGLGAVAGRLAHSLASLGLGPIQYGRLLPAHGQEGSDPARSADTRLGGPAATLLRALREVWRSGAASVTGGRCPSRRIPSQSSMITIRRCLRFTCRRRRSFPSLASTRKGSGNVAPSW